MEQFNLDWHTYNDHLKEMMQKLMQTNESSDVTLVCEDKTKFKAHKFVLSASSPVFQSIINDLPQKDPIVYLRGVFAPEMKSILQFIYLGQATFYQDRMNEFLSVSRTLEIKEISRDVDSSNVPDSTHAEEYYEKIKLNDNEIEINENPNNVEKEFGIVETKLKIHANEVGQHPCNKCEKNFIHRRNLITHTKCAHEGMKFSCHNCVYKASSKFNLLRHFKSVHEGSTLDKC